MRGKKCWWGVIRICLGLIFLWAFFDKLFGLGFSTTVDKSWLLGNSPTAGFLKFSTQGPLASFYQGLVGNVFVDWVFMIGLLLLGIALTLGIGMRIAAYTGALLMILMYSAALPPKNHPFLDEHIIYALVLLALAASDAGKVYGLGNAWSKSRLVKKYPFLT